MATLVLSVVGGAVAGPIGAALGAMAGNAIDHAVFRPAARDGPRLADLKVQTSSYGAPIPKVWGTMRVAGCVIWATDLQEHRDREGGGKGRPDTVAYSYTASFAVALSSRPVLAVGRIWADGKLLRGAVGDWKAETGFRLHLGGEEQTADPLIAAHENGVAPAHRGIAYAVFEDLALADFGNRIPSLTFELIADAGAADAGAVIAEASGGLVEAEARLLAVHGFSGHGDAREVVALLADAAGAWFAPGPDRIAVRSLAGEVRVVTDAGAGRETGRQARAVRPIETVPRVLRVAHYDPARDYQTGVQEARRPGAGHAEARIELPAALDASAARTIAEAMLARAETARVRRTVALDIGAAGIAPGDAVTIGGEAGSWRVTSVELAASVVTLELAPLAPAPIARAGDGGRVLGAPDLVIGRTMVEVFELPPLDGTLATEPRVVVAAAGTGMGWRRAALLVSHDGVSWRAGGMTALPAVMGTVTAPPDAGSETLFDLVNAIEVDLLHADMALTGAADDALGRGANLAMVGDELLQFGTAVQIGATRWRLGRLLRARRGVAAAHGVGERFVLVEPEALVGVPAPAASLGGAVTVLASGVGDDAPAEATTTVTGVSVAPPAPVHLRVESAPDGAGVLRWVPRSRAGWNWNDGLDVPLGETREAYRVTIGARTLVVETPEVAITAGERAAHARAEVRQIGNHAASPAATIDL